MKNVSETAFSWNLAVHFKAYNIFKTHDKM